MMMHYTDFPHPWPTMEERHWIRKTSAVVALAWAEPVIVHIGVELGISLYASYAGAPGAHLVGIDLDTGNLAGDLDCELIQGDSGKVDFDGPVHFVFVDGDHSEAGVRADLENWVDRVEVGGVIAFHDYHNQKLLWCLGVSQAVDAWDWSEWEELPAVHSIKAFVRKTRKEPATEEAAEE